MAGLRRRNIDRRADSKLPAPTRNGPLQRHQGIRKACVNGGCQCLSVVPILWLQVTSIDKRIDFPRIHLDHHQLPSEFFGACERDESAPLEFSGRASAV